MTTQIYRPSAFLQQVKLPSNAGIFGVLVACHRFGISHTIPIYLYSLLLSNHAIIDTPTKDTGRAVKFAFKPRHYIALAMLSLGVLVLYDLYPLIHWQRKQHHLQKTIGRPWNEVEPELLALGLKGNVHKFEFVQVEVYPYRLSRISRAIYAAAIWYDRSNAWVELRYLIFPSAMLTLDATGNIELLRFR